MTILAEDIIAAHDRIRPFVHRTPVITSSQVDAFSGAHVFFKCENLQRIGAFKIRGAMNAVLSLPAEKLENGIATHSSGNHAQAIAYAARQTGVKAYIVMPENSPAVKVNAVMGYGAEITFCEATQAAREATLHAIVERTGAAFIHPYNDERVIARQSTGAKELLEEVPEIEVLLAPVGGGGLLSGSLLTAHYFSPKTVVFAGEPEGAADAVLSIAHGKIEAAPYINTIADGLMTKLGDKTFPFIRDLVAGIITVSDAEIIAAMKLIYERMKLVVEPSAAVPFAALLKEKERFRGKKTGIILSGGNVDLSRLSGWFN